MSNQIIFADSKFTAEYTVVIKLWNKNDVKTYNHYNNLRLKMTEYDNLFEFEKSFGCVQETVAFFIIQQEIYEVDCIIICEYSYGEKLLATEYVENLNAAFRVIVGKRYINVIESKDKTIEILEEQVKMAKPIDFLRN